MAIVGLRPQPVSDPEPQSPENLRGLVQDRLAETAPSSDGLLALAAREALLGPGKRVRPVVAMLAAAHVGGRAEDALDFGCAVEMAHAASLVLDDLPCMDDAALRRGQPTLHRRHGEDAAVLAAVAISILAGCRDAERSFPPGCGQDLPERQGGRAGGCGAGNVCWRSRR